MGKIKYLLNELIRKDKVRQVISYRTKLEDDAELIMDKPEKRDDYLAMVSDLYKINNFLESAKYGF